MDKQITSRLFGRKKKRWGKLKVTGFPSKIGQDIVGMKIGKYLTINKAVYNEQLNPPLWFSIITPDGIQFAMNSKKFGEWIKAKT